MSSPKRIIAGLFKIFCVVTLICLSCYQFFIFVQNEDVSVVNYKKFNSDGDSVYPAISVCVHSTTGNIFDETSPLIQSIDGGVDGYHEILLGHKDGPKSIAYNDVTKDLFKNFVELFFTMTNDGEIINSWHSNLKEKKYRSGRRSQLPFFRSYQDPYFSCMTKKSNFIANQIINLDTLSLISSSLESSNIEHLLVYIHEPGHLIKQFGKQILQLSQADFENATIGINNKYDISINQVDVLRRRNKPDAECNEMLRDEDRVWREKVTESVGCIPSYWEGLENDLEGNYVYSTSLNRCNQTTEYEQIASTYLPPKHTDNGRKLYTGSCNQMEIISSVTKSNSPGNNLLINFNYMSENYRETRNIRAIGVINLLSSIGGFIGLLIGFGLFQVIFSNHISSFCTVLFQKNTDR